MIKNSQFLDFNDVINISSLSMLVYYSCQQRLRWRNQSKNLNIFLVPEPFSFVSRRPLLLKFVALNPWKSTPSSTLPSPSPFGICIRSIDWVLRKFNGNHRQNDRAELILILVEASLFVKYTRCWRHCNLKETYWTAGLELRQGA